MEAERRFAPTTVRISRNTVRNGLEQVSELIGIRKRGKPQAVGSEIGIGQAHAEFSLRSRRTFAAWRFLLSGEGLPCKKAESVKY
jgi:hypothetical protein